MVDGARGRQGVSCYRSAECEGDHRSRLTKPGPRLRLPEVARFLASRVVSLPLWRLVIPFDGSAFLR